MNKVGKTKVRKVIAVKENRKNRRVKKKIKHEEVEEEVKQKPDEESEEEQDEHIPTECDENVNNSDDNVDNRDEDVSNGEGNDNSENGEESVSDTNDSEEEEKQIVESKRKRRREKYDRAEEARLERIVFGDASDVINNLLGSVDPPKNENTNETTQLEAGIDDSDSSDSDAQIQSEIEDDEDYGITGKSRVAWVDDEDAQYSVKGALREQHRRLPGGRPEKVYTELLENKFTKIVGTPKWASLDPAIKDEDEDGDSDNEILKHSNHLVVSKVKKLRKGIIEIKALTDINKSTHIEGPVVTSLQFHPTSTVALVAGLSGVLSLFQVDGRENTKLQSIRFERFGIGCAKFLREGTEVIMGSRNRNYSQVYDLMSGKTYKIPLPHGITNMQKFDVSPDGKFIAILGRMGQIHLLSSVTKELIANFKMNKRCLALAFSPDSDKLFSHGDSDEIYIWDLKSRSCLHKAIDDGCIASSALAFSPSGQFVATGSKQGVVNIYETETILKNRNPTPLKIILNLVTPISKLKFNPTSEILAMASSFKENAFKMVHIPSFTVFSNFPTFQTKMYNPLDIDFSPASGYLGLSNDKGHAYLYRLKHYGNY